MEDTLPLLPRELPVSDYDWERYFELVRKVGLALAELPNVEAARLLRDKAEAYDAWTHQQFLGTLTMD